MASLIARFLVPTWGPSGADRTQVGPMLAPWTLLSGIAFRERWLSPYLYQNFFREYRRATIYFHYILRFYVDLWGFGSCYVWSRSVNWHAPQTHLWLWSKGTNHTQISKTLLIYLTLKLVKCISLPVKKDIPEIIHTFRFPFVRFAVVAIYQ